MKRNRRGRLTTWICGALVALASGCGGPDATAPPDGDGEQDSAVSSSQENARAIASERSNESAPARSAPSNSPPAAAALSEVQQKPVPPPAFAEVVEVLDLRTAFDDLPGAGEVDRQLTSIYYEAPGTIEEAVESYTEQLTGAGWEFDKVIQKDSTSQMSNFLKDGFLLMLNVNRASQPGQVGVSLHNFGPVRSTALPRPSAASLAYEMGSAASYVVTSEMLADAGFDKNSDKYENLVDAGAAYLRSELSKQGWTEFEEKHSTGPFGSDVILGFMQNAAKLLVYVRNRSKDEVSFDYQAYLIDCGFSVIGAATKVTLSDSSGVLQYKTDASAQDVIDHYRTELAVLGWRPMQDGEQFSDIGGQLVLEREGDKCVNVIALQRQQGGADANVSKIDPSDAAELIEKLKSGDSGEASTDSSE